MKLQLGAGQFGPNQSSLLQNFSLAAFLASASFVFTTYGVHAALQVQSPWDFGVFWNGVDVHSAGFVHGKFDLIVSLSMLPSLTLSTTSPWYFVVSAGTGGASGNACLGAVAACVCSLVVIPPVVFLLQALKDITTETMAVIAAILVFISPPFEAGHRIYKFPEKFNVPCKGCRFLV
jgi:hypothetical protein